MQVYQWDKAGFQSSYWKQYYKQRGCGAAKAHNCRCSEIDISYSRQFFEDDNLFKVRAQNIVDKLQLIESTDIFVIGCGLGFIMEELKLLNMNVWGCDNSNYIHTIKNKEKVKVPIYNIDATSLNFVDSVRNAAGAMWFDVIITEDMLTSHNDFNQIFNNCEGILNPSLPKTNIVHLVNESAALPFTSHSLSTWANFKPEHTWVGMIGK